MAEHSTTVAVTLQTVALDEQAQAKRTPLDIVTVLDRSGSMQGQKIKLCQDTVSLLIRELRGADRFGLVSFDHNVRSDVALTPMGDAEAREAAEAKARKLSPGGTTNLSGGLLEGLQNVGNAPVPAAAATKAATKAVLLLTDGHANQGVTDPEKLLSLLGGVLDGASGGVSVYTFGYGADHNAELLQRIAGAAGDGRGGYYFVESAEAVVGCFADCLGGLLSVVAQNVKLEIEALPGATIERVRRDGATPVEGSGGRVWQCDLGDLFAEETRDILVDVRASPTTEADAAAGGRPLVRFRLSYADALACNLEKHEAEAPPLQRLAPGSAGLAAPLDSHIVTHRARLDTAEALAAARAIADSGDLVSARARLTAARGGVKEAANSADGAGCDLVQRLLQDIDESVTGLSSVATYRGGGGQKMSSKMMGHQMQRCMSDSDSDGEDACEEGFPQSASVFSSKTKVRNQYRGSSKRMMKAMWTGK